MQTTTSTTSWLETEARNELFGRQRFLILISCAHCNLSEALPSAIKLWNRPPSTHACAMPNPPPNNLPQWNNSLAPYAACVRLHKRHSQRLASNAHGWPTQDQHRSGKGDVDKVSFMESENKLKTCSLASILHIELGRNTVDIVAFMLVENKLKTCSLAYIWKCKVTSLAWACLSYPCKNSVTKTPTKVINSNTKLKHPTRKHSSDSAAFRHLQHILTLYLLNIVALFWHSGAHMFRHSIWQSIWHILTVC